MNLRFLSKSSRAIPRKKIKKFEKEKGFHETSPRAIRAARAGCSVES
jgi:hypothetical protein